MSAPVEAGFGDVQRIVLRGGERAGCGWQAAAHLLIDFGERSPLHFISQLLSGCANPDLPPLTAEATAGVTVQVSLGLTRRGLECAHVPDHLLMLMALKAPAFHAGAARRAAHHLALSGRNAAELWDWGQSSSRVAAGMQEATAFRLDAFDAVVSLHGPSARSLDAPLAAVRSLAAASAMTTAELPHGQTIEPPTDLESTPGTARPGTGQWVHFGYLDGLSKTGIKGVTSAPTLAKLKPLSRHEPGEFVLGHVQDSGGNPWVAGPGLRVWPEDARAFFHNGSFGVLQLIEQDVQAFEDFVGAAAVAGGLSRSQVKGLLCGRSPEGLPLAAPAAGGADFDYEDDRAGLKCPFGSHIRRMNPRLPVDAEGRVLLDHTPGIEQPAHFSRRRPLLRRGMPYGRAWTGQSEPAAESRGLIGHFFCASIEDQFEHLLGEWADRVAMGSPDRGGARDPFIGAHEPGDGPFDLPQPSGQPGRQLRGLAPFTRTRGCAYLFYPSLRTLEGIAASHPWAPDPYADDDA